MFHFVRLQLIFEIARRNYLGASTPERLNKPTQTTNISSRIPRWLLWLNINDVFIKQKSIIATILDLPSRIFIIISHIKSPPITIDKMVANNTICRFLNCVNEITSTDRRVDKQLAIIFVDHDPVTFHLTERNSRSTIEGATLLDDRDIDLDPERFLK